MKMTASKLIAVLALCYLQSIYPLNGIPYFLQVALWSAYIAELVILTARLFGIKIDLLVRVLSLFKR